MDSNTNRGKSSATKKLKGFTLIEMIVVIAIISILAGISSMAISGYVRDSRLEAARNTAQEVYTGIQNTLVQLEIKQQEDLLDPSKYGAAGTPSKYITLELVMDNGLISSNDLIIAMGTADNQKVTLPYSYPNSTSTTDEKEKNFRKLAKYITDNLSMDFTGYVYAAIDMEDWVVDSVVYVEDYNKVKNATNKIKDFVPMFKKKTSGSSDISSASDGRIPFCDDIIRQKKIYKGVDTDALEAGGTAVGYYPFYNDIKNSTTVSYS
ncbi:MAG: type II secretion system protein [Oscillospiraceae bacterium]